MTQVTTEALKLREALALRCVQAAAGGTQVPFLELEPGDRIRLPKICAVGTQEVYEWAWRHLVVDFVSSLSDRSVMLYLRLTEEQREAGHFPHLLIAGGMFTAGALRLNLEFEHKD